MKATVSGLSRINEDIIDARNGDEIEIIGFVYHGQSTWALYVDDYGGIAETPVWTLRVKPDEDKAFKVSRKAILRDRGWQP